jgi:hypothetical protein
MFLLFLKSMYINGTCKCVNSHLMEVFKEKLFQKSSFVIMILSIEFELSDSPSDY